MCNILLYCIVQFLDKNFIVKSVVPFFSVFCLKNLWSSLGLSKHFAVNFILLVCKTMEIFKFLVLLCWCKIKVVSKTFCRWCKGVAVEFPRNQFFSHYLQTHIVVLPNLTVYQIYQIANSKSTKDWSRILNS